MASTRTATTAQILAYDEMASSLGWDSKSKLAEEAAKVFKELKPSASAADVKKVIEAVKTAEQRLGVK